MQCLMKELTGILTREGKNCHKNKSRAFTAAHPPATAYHAVGALFQSLHPVLKCFF